MRRLSGFSGKPENHARRKQPHRRIIWVGGRPNGMRSLTARADSDRYCSRRCATPRAPCERSIRCLSPSAFLPFQARGKAPDRPRARNCRATCLNDGLPAIGPRRTCQCVSFAGPMNTVDIPPRRRRTGTDHVRRKRGRHAEPSLVQERRALRCDDVRAGRLRWRVVWRSRRRRIGRWRFWRERWRRHRTDPGVQDPCHQRSRHALRGRGLLGLLDPPALQRRQCAGDPHRLDRQALARERQRRDTELLGDRATPTGRSTAAVVRQD